MTAFLALLLLLQQEEFISKAAKGPYLEALDKYEQARNASAGDAVDMLTAIIESSKVEKKECKLKIEISSGNYKRVDFYPYQLRGQSRVKQAATAEPDRALTHLDKAIADFEESVKRGLKASDGPLGDAFLARGNVRVTMAESAEREKAIEILDRAIKDFDDATAHGAAGAGASASAKQRVAALKAAATGVDPEPDFLREWRSLVNSGRFAAAKAHVGAKGGFLTDPKRQQYVKDVDIECDKYMASAAASFLTSLEDAGQLQRLKTMERETFARRFELPDGAELTVARDDFSWCRYVRDTLAVIREGKPFVAALLNHATNSIGIADKGGGVRWYKSVEALAYASVYEDIEKRAEESRNAPADRRAALRKEADELSRQWQDFDARVRQATDKKDYASQIPARDFKPLFERFPVDDDSVKKYATDLLATAAAEDPDRALSEIEDALSKLWDKSERMSLESRRSIVTYRIVAAALRGFLKGSTVDDVTRSTRVLGSDLRGVGGALDVSSFGPKIQQVVEKLR